MEEEGYAKKGSLSSSSPSWASRLSPLAQPFSLKRETSQSQGLSSLASSKSNPRKPIAPSTSNDHDPIGDSHLSNSFSELFIDDLLTVSSDCTPSVSAISVDGHNPIEFGSETSCSQNKLGSFQGFCGQSLIDESFADKPWLSTHTKCSSTADQGRTNHGDYLVSLNEARSLALESFLKQDSAITPFRVSAAQELLSSSTFQNRVPTLGSSITNATFSSSGRILSNTADLLNHSLIRSNGLSDGRNILLNANNKEVHQEKSLAHRIKETKVEKSEHESTSEDTLYGLAQKNFGTVTGIPTNYSPKMLNEDEDDLDSPCWKGIKNSGKSSGRVPEAVCSNSPRNQSDLGLSLNPKAPHFFPSRAKGATDYPQKNLEGVGFNPQPQDQLLIDFHKTVSEPPGFSHATRDRRPNKIHESGKVSFAPKSSKTSSALDLPQMTNPCRVEGIFPDINPEVSANGTVFDRPENFLLDPSADCSFKDFSEILQYLSQPLSNRPNINVSMMVKSIYYLSESLVQNYANDFDSLNEQYHEMLHGSIGNLGALIKRRIGEKTLMLGLPHSGSLDFRNKSTTIRDHEKSNMDFKVSRLKDMAVRHEPDRKWGNGYSLVTANKMQDLASSSRDVCSETRSGIVPLLRAPLKDSHQIDEESRPQALLNLWIEAQAALCYAKYENHILRMKLQQAGSRVERV